MICNCSLAGTRACDNCNNGYSYTEVTKFYERVILENDWSNMVQNNQTPKKMYDKHGII
jgi:hypothetical protein